MRYLLFITSAVFLVGCITHAPEPQEPEGPPAEIDTEVDERQAELDRHERHAWHQLDQASNLLVAHTHILNTRAAETDFDEIAEWRSAVWVWCGAVRGWMAGLDRLRTAHPSRSRVLALLSLENDLLELESRLRNLEHTYEQSGISDANIAESLGRLRAITEQARNGVFLANLRYINLYER